MKIQNVVEAYTGLFDPTGQLPTDEEIERGVVDYNKELREASEEVLSLLVGTAIGRVIAAGAAISFGVALSGPGLIVAGFARLALIVTGAPAREIAATDLRVAGSPFHRLR